jgi:multisubunit Na+/H+ antiporter MnhC subunit
MMVLGITLIALVIGAAVTAVVLWYFFQVSESQNLN